MKKSLFVFAAFIFACFFATAQDAGEILDDKTAAGVEAGADTDASLNEEAVAEGNAPADENEEASVEKSTGNAAAEFSTGEWYGNVYTNDFIGIKYELPQGWEKYGDEEIAEIMNLGKEFLNDNQKNMRNFQSSLPSITFLPTTRQLLIRFASLRKKHSLEFLPTCMQRGSSVNLKL